MKQWKLITFMFKIIWTLIPFNSKVVVSNNYHKALKMPMTWSGSIKSGEIQKLTYFFAAIPEQTSFHPVDIKPLIR